MLDFHGVASEANTCMLSAFPPRGKCCDGLLPDESYTVRPWMALFSLNFIAILSVFLSLSRFILLLNVVQSHKRGMKFSAMQTTAFCTLIFCACIASMLYGPRKFQINKSSVNSTWRTRNITRNLILDKKMQCIDILSCVVYGCLNGPFRLCLETI